MAAQRFAEFGVQVPGFIYLATRFYCDVPTPLSPMLEHSVEAKAASTS